MAAFSGKTRLREHGAAIITCLLVALVAFSVGWYFSRFETLRESENNIALPVRYNDPEYPLISSLVSVSIPNATGFPELKAAKSDVEAAIARGKAERGVREVGVYFRQPLNAHWFGIYENGAFDPGSLIKVPILMAYLKLAEADSAVLKKRLTYSSKSTVDVPNPLPSSLKNGLHSTEELLRAMIVESDNPAKDALLDNIDPAAIQDVFDEINLNFLKDPSGTISPRQYVILFSRIYNATYLNRFYSNYAMDLLSKTSFKSGLVAGVPSDVRVAHKYGERGVYEDKALVGIELHDCGLVYAENDAYYLCIMTRGTDEAALVKTIRDISAAVYEHREEFKPAP